MRARQVGEVDDGEHVLHLGVEHLAEGLGGQARRRREDTTLQIRKNKREEGLAKRRAFQRDVAPVLAPKPDAGNPAAPERPTVADMPRLLNEIQSQDPAVVVAATRGWRKLLSVEPQPPVDAVLATGVVAPTFPVDQ